ncbi:GP46-like surface antigen, putative, partial [Bodo saltans]
MMKRSLNRCVTTRPSAKKRKSLLLVVVQLTFVSLLFTFFSLVITTAHVGAACSCQDQLAPLSEFYNATDGPVSWANKWDLTSTSAPCGFYGVTCDDAAGAITSIVLVSNNLRGSLPKSLSLLGSLFQVFVVNNNAISGTLPDSYHNWTNMMNFSVKSNLFTGPLPSSYSLWQAITSFNVGTTNISGTLPLAYGTSTGWCTSLNIFAIQNCAGINGTLPPEYGNWSNLGVMNAEGTGLSGPIPAEYAQWRHIDTISFTNVLGVGNLSGTISAKLSSGWVNLTQLSLRGNKFTGSLPHGVAPGEVIWPKMRNFVLAQNQFGGTLPV